ncbi:MAG: bifunctional oligoribonuclease/PAP phosphatase NrnA [Mailhella sp.]|nr:bifunctional oligoribonuclease/PAP phosphatase NrnA [Mailhella sp.]
MTTESPVPAEVLSALRGAKRVLIASHLRPDGDAMGSCLALAWVLRSMGSEALVYNGDGMPAFLGFLPLPCPVLDSPEKLPGAPDLIAVLDCGEASRAGEALLPLLERIPSVNIDHHPGNPLFGTAGNWVDPAMSSAGEMTALIAQAAGTPLTGPLAQCLYVAIATDTGNFTHGNTTPRSLRLTAEMREGGLDISRLHALLENRWGVAKYRLWARLMDDTRILEEGRLAAALVTPEALRGCGASRDDAEGFVDQLRRLAGVRVALLLKEEEKDGARHTRASLRSSGDDDVRAVAARFGGGGHLNAAGADLPMDAESALDAMLPFIRLIWEGTGQEA